MNNYDSVLAVRLIAKARDGTYERNQLGRDLADQLEAAAKEVERLRVAFQIAARGSAVQQINATSALRETQEQLAEADLEIARLREGR